MVLGIIFDETSTQGFTFLYGDVDGERQNQLKFSYVEVNLPDSNDKVVAKVIEVNTENPLLAKDTAKFYSEQETNGIPIPDIISDRFTLYKAKCEVMGVYNSTTSEIEPLSEAIKPGEQVKFLNDDILQKLFSKSNEWYLSLGQVKIPGRDTQAHVSLNADSITTMHAGIFGMTGMGKTTTTAVVLEELMFRGAKTIVFDPHQDYVNLNKISPDLYDSFKSNIENDTDLMNIISEYKCYLSKNLPKLDKVYSDKIKIELKDENIFYRLLNFCLIKNPHLMIVDPKSIPEDVLDSVISEIKQLDWKDKDILPQELVSRMLALELNAYPGIKMYPDKSAYFTMRLIEAMAWENFTTPQTGYIIPWLQELSAEQRKKLSDIQLLDYLIKKVVDELNRNDSSRGAINRILNRAKLSVETLKKRNCQPIDVSEFVKNFCSLEGKWSKVSTVVFNLSDLENDQVRRSLVYAIMNFAFDRYKSKDFRIEDDANAHPILFALEEARTLIPHQEYSSTGEMNPATQAARSAAQNIATEGRKMGLGMLIITQKPASVDSLTTSQANTLILHRVINPIDQSYIKDVGESLSGQDLETLKTVSPGVAIVTGNALESQVSPLVKIRNRYSEPGAKRPRPIQNKWEKQEQ